MRTAGLWVRPGEEGRGFFQEFVLHPQSADLVFHFLHAGSLHRVDRRFGFGVFTAPGVDPVAQGAVMDPEITSDLRDWLAGLEDHLDGFGLELGTEPTSLLGHVPILSSGRTCPRSLVHLTPPAP